MSDFDKINGPIIKKPQPFGEHSDPITMPGQGRPPEHINRPLGGLTMRGNNGVDHGPTFDDKNPGAHNEACKGVDHPFNWTGHPGKFNPNMKNNVPNGVY
jgi:hypothetical protein